MPEEAAAVYELGESAMSTWAMVCQTRRSGWTGPGVR